MTENNEAESNEAGASAEAAGGKKSKPKKKKLTAKEQMLEFVKLVVVLAIAAAGYGCYWLYKDNVATPFTLDTQRHVETTVDFTGEKPVLVIISGLDARDQTTAWVTKTIMSYGMRVDYARIVNLVEENPRIHYVIQGQMVKIPVDMLMDFDGEVSKSFHSKPGVANVLVVAPGGRVKARVRGDMTDEAWEKIASATDALLAAE